MKKTVLVMVSLLLICCILTACGGTDAPEVSAPNTETQIPEGNTENAVSESDEEPSAPNVIYNNGGIKITFTGLSYENTWWNIKLNIENNTDNDINVSSSNVSFNGFMCPSAGGSSDCPANSAAEVVWEFNNYATGYSVVGGLNEVSSVGIEPVITYTDGSDMNYEYGEFVTVNTETVSLPVSSENFEFVKESKKVVFENDFCTVTCLGLAEDFQGLSGYQGIYFKVDNKCNYPIVIMPHNEISGYEDIISSIWLLEECVLNGKACECGNFSGANISANSSVVIFQTLHMEELGFTLNEVTSYKFAFAVNARYDVITEEATEPFNFEVDIAF